MPYIVNIIAISVSIVALMISTFTFIRQYIKRRKNEKEYFTHITPSCSEIDVDGDYKHKIKVMLISGKALHGKDTIANFVKEQLEKEECRAEILHFADSLKKEAKLVGWDGTKGEQQRQVLIDLAKSRRNIDPEYFVKKVVNDIKTGTCNIYLIPDTRYKNEIEYMKSIKDFSVITVRVCREGFDNKLTNSQKRSESETQLDNHKFDYFIHNNGTLDELREKAEILTKILQ